MSPTIADFKTDDLGTSESRKLGWKKMKSLNYSLVPSPLPFAVVKQSIVPNLGLKNPNPSRRNSVRQSFEKKIEKILQVVKWLYQQAKHEWNIQWETARELPLIIADFKTKEFGT